MTTTNASVAAPDPAAPRRDVELLIGGMTCASCAARIEKRLNRITGVTATVNFATERAKVTYPDTVTTGELLAGVEATGYRARLPEPTGTHPDSAQPSKAAAESDGDVDPTRPLRQRLAVSAALAAPVVVMAMVPAAQFRNWQWASLTLAAPVVVWGAWPFHQAAWTNLRHRAATMDTLVRLVAVRPVRGRRRHGRHAYAFRAHHRADVGP